MLKASSDFAAWYTTLLCIVPPKSGCGWARTAASGGCGLPAGVQRIASRRPAGPSKKKLRESCMVIDTPWTDLQFSARKKKDLMQEFLTDLFDAPHADVQSNVTGQMSTSHHLGQKLTRAAP